MKLLRLSVLTVLLLQLYGCAVLLVGGAATSGYIVAQDRRTAGTMLNDQRIEVRIKDYLTQDKEMLEATHLKVRSYNGIVLLAGETTRADYAQRLNDYAKAETHVREVRNELQIGEPSEMAYRRNDVALTSRVRSRLFSDGDVRSAAVKVTVSQGTVYLMGLVTRDEADLAVETVRQVEGVQRIVRIFEFVKGD